jgi:hypothetical protein
MHSTETTAERVLEAGNLRVRFYWHGDRYAHEVSVRSGDGWLPALVSVEGSPEHDWPASPPFQSLHIEQRDDGRTLALLVGMAGKSHWSASIEIDPQVPCVAFDVACRARGCEAGSLRSSYRVADAAVSNSAVEAGELLAIELGHRFGPATLEIVEGVSRVVAQIDVDGNPQTIRWDYRLRVA